jgi:hypothetical protein
MNDLRLQTALSERADGLPAVHASEPNQVSVIRRKLLTQDDFATWTASPSRFSRSKGATTPPGVRLVTHPRRPQPAPDLNEPTRPLHTPAASRMTPANQRVAAFAGR